MNRLSDYLARANPLGDVFPLSGVSRVKNQHFSSSGIFEVDFDGVLFVSAGGAGGGGRRAVNPGDGTLTSKGGDTVININGLGSIVLGGGEGGVSWTSNSPAHVKTILPKGGEPIIPEVILRKAVAIDCRRGMDVTETDDLALPGWAQLYSDFYAGYYERQRETSNSAPTSPSGGGKRGPYSSETTASRQNAVKGGFGGSGSRAMNSSGTSGATGGAGGAVMPQLIIEVKAGTLITVTIGSGGKKHGLEASDGSSGFADFKLLGVG